MFGQGGLAVGEFPEFDDVVAVGQGLVGGGEPASEPTWMMRGLVVMLSYKWVAKGPSLIRAQWPGRPQGGCWLLVHLGLSRVPWRGARAVSGLANDGRGVDAFIGCSALQAIECAGPIGLGYCSGRESSHMDSRIFRIFLILVSKMNAAPQADRPIGLV